MAFYIHASRTRPKQEEKSTFKNKNDKCEVHETGVKRFRNETVMANPPFPYRTENVKQLLRIKTENRVLP